MVVDPWGKVLLEMGGVQDCEERGPELGVVDIDLGYWERIRSEMPLLRRT